MSETRGERNNNPGNIDQTAQLWTGQVHDAREQRFCTFDTPENGIRALAKVLLTYYRKHNLDTVSKIINRWAPPVENDSGAYINHVSPLLGVGQDAVIDVQDPDTLEILARAIIQHENGRCIYTDATLVKAVDSALA